MEKPVKYNCIESLKKEGSPIIIVAALYEAEAIYNACLDNNIKVEAFCDSEMRRTENSFCGLEVIHSPTLPERLPKARFIIATQHIQDVVDQMTDFGYSEFYSAMELLEKYDVESHQHQISKEYMNTRIAVYKKSYSAYYNDKKTYMRSVDIMVTTKCSLKCESCSNLMQYYQSPQNTKNNEIIDALNILHDHVDEISEFRIIGGEPMMNREWDLIVDDIATKNKKSKILIYTNGTIAPKEEKLEKLKNKNINFVITSYGKLSRNIDLLTERLDKYNLTYVSRPAEDWIDCSSLKHHKRNVKDLEEVFKQCCVKYVYTLLNGKLYRCPFIANADNLNAIPDNPANYVDLFSDKVSVQKQINRLVGVAKFFPGCDFCDGRPYNPSSSKGYDGKGMIKPGIQTKKPLPYNLYK
jgi:organic radical activating enzyme